MAVETPSAVTRRDWGPWIVTAIFAAIEFVAISHHVLWRDETQAWEIACGSPSFWALFPRLQYEGHPSLWFVVLYFVSQISHNPRAMQLLHWALATSTVFVLMKFSPFKFAQKTGLAFGYFLAYEYAVISRGYVLGALLAFVMCALISRKQRSIFAMAIVLFLMANVSVYSLFIALAFVIGLAVERITAPKDIRRNISRAEIAGLLIVLLGAGFSVATVFPKLHAHYQTAEIPDASFARGKVPGYARPLELTLFRLWQGAEPVIKPMDKTAVWGTNWVIDALPEGKWVASFGTIFLYGSCLWIFRRRAMALSFFVLGTAALIVAFLWNAPDQTRHIGHFYIVMLAAFWLAMPVGSAARINADPASDPRKSALAKCVLWFLIVGQCAGTAVAMGFEWHRPFSQSSNFADFMKTQPADSVIIVNPEWKCSEIGALLDRDSYFPVAQTSGRYAFYSEKSLVALDDDLMAAFRHFDEMKQPVYLVSGFPMTAARIDGYRLDAVARFVGAMAPNEDFYVYRVSVAPVTQTSSPATGNPVGR
jgi:hypothetical protein